MSSEIFDNKIKELLEQETPPYDEHSWHKMKILLDRYMPLKKDNRRKLILFFFLFLLLGGGVFLMINNNNSGKEITAIPNHSNSIISKSETQSLNSTTKIKEENTIPRAKESHQRIVAATNPLFSQKRKISSGKKMTEPAALSTVSDSEKNFVTKLTVDNPSSKTDQGNEIAEISSNKTEPGFKSHQDPVTTLQSEQVVKEKLNESNPSVATKKIVSKKKQSFLKNILVNFSAGPDISSVGNKTGKVKMTLGAGLGYKLSDHFTIRTGIFSGRKIYTTGPENYNPPANFWAYYPNLKSIDADCKILEVPLNLDYNFGISKKQNWFASAGISSLFMKKEVYNYYYKPANSQQYVYYSRTYENKNKHYFSILSLSGGYARKISPAITLQAEPYMKIALKGVGYGKVKLNSAGLLLTASLRPFQSKK